MAFRENVVTAKETGKEHCEMVLCGFHHEVGELRIINHY
jgi:hypothetical protein